MREQRIEFSPAFDKRDSDPKKNYGIHGVTLTFYLIGEEGAVQFVVYTNWHLPHVEKEFDAKPMESYDPCLLYKPMAADLGYHSKRPIYDGQEPMTDECHLLGGKCYYDGSSLNADPVFDRLRSEGSVGVWSALEEFYADIFLNEDNSNE